MKTKSNAPMKTKVSAYRGILIFSAGDTLLASPESGMNIGCVVDLSEVEITQEAFDLIKEVAMSGDSIGDIDVFKTQSPAGGCLAWLGGQKSIKDPKACEASRQYAPKLLQPYIVPDFPPDPEAVAVINESLETERAKLT